MIHDLNLVNLSLGVTSPTRVTIRPRITIERIQEVVAAYYGIPKGHMKSPTRSRYVARPRQIAMYLARDLKGFTLSSIGRLFGDRDHTTVRHAIIKVTELIEADEDLACDVALLRERLAI